MLEYMHALGCTILLCSSMIHHSFNIYWILMKIYKKLRCPEKIKLEKVFTLITPGSDKRVRHVYTYI
jgi:hypothetical protein